MTSFDVYTIRLSPILALSACLTVIEARIDLLINHVRDPLARTRHPLTLIKVFPQAE